MCVCVRTRAYGLFLNMEFVPLCLEEKHVGEIFKRQIKKYAYITTTETMDIYL